LYKYVHNPYEEKNIKLKKERKRKARLAGGLVDGPCSLTDRSINKLFDSRKTHIEVENNRHIAQPNGNLSPPVREQVMSLGSYTVGALKG